MVPSTGYKAAASAEKRAVLALNVAKVVAQIENVLKWFHVSANTISDQRFIESVFRERRTTSFSVKRTRRTRTR